MRRYYLALGVLACTVGMGCGGASYANSSGHYETSGNMGMSNRDVYDSPPMAPQEAYYDFDDDIVEGQMMLASLDYEQDYATSRSSSSSDSRSQGSGGSGGLFGGESERSEMVAQAGPTNDGAPPVQATPAPEIPDATVEEMPEDADDDSPQPMLIYNGQITLAVYEVETNQEAAIALVEEQGGYASERSSHSVTFRVPAENFRETLDAIATLGDVLGLTWSAQDVSEEFLDVEIRLRNALEMRTRLEALLDDVTTIQEALAIEQQLERITLQIEQLRGRMRFLMDRIGYSTIVLTFSPIPQNSVPGDEYRLPFPWLNQLGLENLLSL